MAEGKQSSQKVVNVKEELCSIQMGITRTFRDLRPSHCLLKIDSYSLFNKEKYESDIFEAGGYKWRLVFYPDGDRKRNGKGFISLYISIVETNDFPQGWEVNVNFKLFVLDQTREKYLTIQDGDGTISQFSDVKMERGIPQLLSLDVLKNASHGYLIDDSCVLGAEVFVHKNACKLQRLSFANKLVGNTFTWKIDGFSTLDKQYYYSEEFIFSGIRWKLLVYPKRDGDNLSLYLQEVDVQDKREVCTDYTLRIQDQVSRGHHKKTFSHLFTSREVDWGLAKFISHKELHDSSKGFVRKDSVIVGVEFIAININYV